MDGYAVARALRHEPALASSYLIALTGYAQEDDQRCAREAGFNRHMTKPVDFGELQAVLASLLERSCADGACQEPAPIVLVDRSQGSQ
jgi:two-component system CheB/CheR fusion protein